MSFIDHLDANNRAIFESLKSPCAIQAYLDSLPYIGEERDRSPLQVMQDRQCHCLDGGLFAALALSQIGYPARIIDLVPEPYTDDDHVLAIFQVEGFYGAVAKSNFSPLRFREPVFRSLRELVMSYFEVFFNIDRLKTLRGYTRPLNLSTYDRYHWQTREDGVAVVTKRLYTMKPVPVVNQAQVARLSLIDERSFHTNMAGVNLDGLYKGPKKDAPSASAGL